MSATPSKKWTVADVFRTIQSSEKSVTENLDGFAKEGLLFSEAPGVYQYLPRTSDLDQGLTELLKAYQTRRVAIVEAIYNKPADGIQDFADAFKIRKEK